MEDTIVAKRDGLIRPRQRRWGRLSMNCAVAVSVMASCARNEPRRHMGVPEAKMDAIHELPSEHGLNGNNSDSIRRVAVVGICAGYEERHEVWWLTDGNQCERICSGGSFVPRSSDDQEYNVIHVALDVPIAMVDEQNPKYYVPRAIQSSCSIAKDCRKGLEVKVNTALMVVGMKIPASDKTATIQLNSSVLENIPAYPTGVSIQDGKGVRDGALERSRRKVTTFPYRE